MELLLLKNKTPSEFDVGQAALHLFTQFLHKWPRLQWVTCMCSAKTSYLSYWEQQLVLPHSALHYFSFPGPPAKGISESSYSKGAATTPLEGPVPSLLQFFFVASQPNQFCSPVTKTLTGSCLKTFWNAVLCSSIPGQTFFSAGSASGEKHSRKQT